MGSFFDKIIFEDCPLLESEATDAYKQRKAQQAAQEKDKDQAIKDRGTRKMISNMDIKERIDDYDRVGKEIQRREKSGKSMDIDQRRVAVDASLRHGRRREHPTSFLSDVKFT